MEVGFKSDKGIRRSNNEDACFVLPAERTFFVADGVGGGNAGEIASRTAVSEIANYIVEHPLGKIKNKYAIVNYLQDCMDSTNEKIFELSQRYEENKGMATTVAMLCIRQKMAYIANIGDSRVYLYRDGALVQLTDDHTYVNTLLKAGVISQDEAEKDSRKNIITKALGAEQTAEPDFFQVEVAEEDIFLLCTDGLYDDVSNERIKEILRLNLSMSELCSTLVDEANMRGGHDNITTVSVKVTEDDLNE